MSQMCTVLNFSCVSTCDVSIVTSSFRCGSVHFPIMTLLVKTLRLVLNLKPHGHYKKLRAQCSTITWWLVERVCATIPFRMFIWIIQIDFSVNWDENLFSNTFFIQFIEKQWRIILYGKWRTVCSVFIIIIINTKCFGSNVWTANEEKMRHY